VELLVSRSPGCGWSATWQLREHIERLNFRVGSDRVEAVAEWTAALARWQTEPDASYVEQAVREAS
jgi:hypothetical protein